jgi:hypothetical protein
MQAFASGMQQAEAKTGGSAAIEAAKLPTSFIWPFQTNPNSFWVIP